MTHMIIGLMLIYVLAVIITKIEKHQVDHRFKSCVGALALIIVATIVDVGRFYKTSNNAGIFGSVIASAEMNSAVLFRKRKISM